MHLHYNILAECCKMGCVTSKKDINDLHPNIFQVSNVDDVGNRLSSGQLEVNDTELVLYQKGKPPVRWPLRSLRRYGHGSQVFSFEAGRRCPTGSGIYAFSCKRADKLFEFVQANVQLRNNEDTVSRNNEDTASRDTGTPAQTRPSSGAYLEPIPATNNIVASSRQSSLPRLTIQPANNNNQHSRLNSVGSSSNGCVSPSPPPHLNNNNNNDTMFLLDDSTSPDSPPAQLYMNISCGGVMVPAALEEEEENHPIYANLSPGETVPPMSPLSPATTIPLPEPRSLTYLVLDLDSGSTNGGGGGTGSGGPESPAPRPSEGYVTIDFDKTEALSHSVNPTFCNEGSRKTRHSSTISDLVKPRQSPSSLSD